MNRKISIAALAAALILSSCASTGEKKNSAASDMVAENQAPLVGVQKVYVESVPKTEVYTTTVQANVINNIAPQAGGRIVAVKAEVGDYVRKGQLLAKMDPNNLLQARLKMRNDSTELIRRTGLYEAGALSESDYQTILMSYKVSKTSYQNLLENTELRSPVEGVVTARNYDEGDLYSMSQPLFTVQQISPVKFYIGVSEREYTRVAVGQKVNLTAEAFPDKEFTGKVVRLYPVIDAATHTFKVEVKVDNSDRSLKPGMFARATLDFGSAQSVVVPDQAIVKQAGSGERFVYVLNADGTVTYRQVVLGTHFGQKYEVVEGLSDGETVVVSGQIRLKDGIAVTIE